MCARFTCAIGLFFGHFEQYRGPPPITHPMPRPVSVPLPASYAPGFNILQAHPGSINIQQPISRRRSDYLACKVSGPLNYPSWTNIAASEHLLLGSAWINLVRSVAELQWNILGLCSRLVQKFCFSRMRIATEWEGGLRRRGNAPFPDSAFAI